VTTAGTTVARLRDQLLGYRRGFGDLMGGAGLFALIGVFLVWASIQERDALVVGVVSGSILALGAVGLTLIYGVLKFGHFAHGDAMMMSAYVAFFFLFGHIVGARPSDDVSVLPFTVTDLPGADHTFWRFSFGYGLLVAMVLSAVVMAVLFIGIDRLIYRKLRQRKSGIVIFSIAALGLAISLRSFVLLVYGPNPRLYYPGIRKRIDLPFDIHILADQLFIFSAAIAVTVVVYVILYRTKLGKAMRAMADNPDLARVSGINTERVIMWTWVVAGALVAVAGVLLALQAQLDPQIGFVLLLPLFAATILGGIGSPQGAFVGGMIVGMVQEVAVTLHLDFIRDGFPGAGYKFSVAFIILIVILLLRPRGLFGAKQ
jgi:branched-chain amino acid transport system permease protein/neutral amino acid transport system permease protein